MGKRWIVKRENGQIYLEEDDSLSFGWPGFFIFVFVIAAIAAFIWIVPYYQSHKVPLDHELAENATLDIVSHFDNHVDEYLKGQIQQQFRAKGLNIAENQEDMGEGNGGYFDRLNVNHISYLGDKKYKIESNFIIESTNNKNEKRYYKCEAILALQLIPNKTFSFLVDRKYSLEELRVVEAL